MSNCDEPQRRLKSASSHRLNST